MLVWTRPWKGREEKKRDRLGGYYNTPGGGLCQVKVMRRGEDEGVFIVKPVRISEGQKMSCKKK